MSGYNTRWSVSTIEFLLDDGFFDDPSHKQDLTLAINELGVHFKYGVISEQKYSFLINSLKNKQE